MPCMSGPHTAPQMDEIPARETSPWQQADDQKERFHYYQLRTRRVFPPHQKKPLYFVASQFGRSLLSIFCPVRGAQCHRAERQQLTHAPSHPKQEGQLFCRFLVSTCSRHLYIKHGISTVILLKVITLMRTMRRTGVVGKVFQAARPSH